MSSFFDYYGGRPPIPEPVSPTPPPATTPVLPPGQGPIDPRYMLRPQYREEDPTEPDYRRDLISGSNPALNVSALQIINPEDVIHGDFATYLDSVGYDMSGKFSGATLKADAQDKDAALAAADFAGTLDAAAGMIMGMGNIIDGPSMTDPTGVGTRSTGAGIFSPIATANLSREFRDINAIAAFNRDPANKGAIGNERGFALRLGDERGSILYRLPGENQYRGDLSLRGISIPQNVARNIENYTMGVDTGQTLLSAITSGKSILDQAVEDVDFSNALLKTGKGGYTLDGKFNFVTGVARVGDLSNLIDQRTGLAGTTFRVTTNGAYDTIESQRIAKSWLRGARNFTSDTPMAQKIAHLVAHIEMATKASDVSKPKVAPISTKGDPAIAAQNQADATTPASGGPTGDDDISSLLESGETRFVNVPGVGFVSPAQARAIRERDDSENPGGRSYSLTREEVSTPSSSGDPRGYSMRALGGDVPSTNRPGFVENEDRLVPQMERDSVLSINELQGDVQESGFIDRPASEVSDAESVADDILIPEAEEDGYIINVEAVKMAGEMDLIKEIEEAEKYVRSKGVDLAKPKRPILASSGEIYVRPEVIPAIGLDKLEKINKRGVPKTKKKLKETRRA